MKEFLSLTAHPKPRNPDPDTFAILCVPRSGSVAQLKFISCLSGLRLGCYDGFDEGYVKVSYRLSWSLRF